MFSLCKFAWEEHLIFKILLVKRNEKQTGSYKGRLPVSVRQKEPVESVFFSPLSFCFIIQKELGKSEFETDGLCFL